MTSTPRSGAPDAGAPAGVAAFDFDGTLTRSDSFIGFLRRVGGPGALPGALRDLPPRLAAARPGAWRDEVKVVLIRRVMTGRPLAEIEREGREYGAALARQVTPPMRSLLERHRRAGHRLVVVSASLELYLSPAAELLGIDAVLGTRLAVGRAGRLTGDLDGANCRGAEKARRLHQWVREQGLDADTTTVWAYGNSGGDRHLLAAATVATRVRRGRPPRADAPALTAPAP